MSSKIKRYDPDCRFIYERIDRSQNADQEEGYRITHADGSMAVAQKRLDFMKDQKIFAGSGNSIISCDNDHLALTCLLVRYRFKDYLLKIERSDNTALSCSENTDNSSETNGETETAETSSAVEDLSAVCPADNQIRPAYKYDVTWYPASGSFTGYGLLFLLLVFVLTSFSLLCICLNQAWSQKRLYDSGFNIARLAKAVSHFKSDNTDSEELSCGFGTQWQNFINQSEFTDLLAKGHDVDCLKVEWFGEKGDPVPETRSIFINSSALRSLKELIAALNILCAEDIEQPGSVNENNR